MFAISLREDRRGFCDAPVNAQRRIVKANAALVGRRIVIGHLVQNFRVRLERDKAMRKTGRTKI